MEQPAGPQHPAPGEQKMNERDQGTPGHFLMKGKNEPTPGPGRGKNKTRRECGGPATGELPVKGAGERREPRDLKNGKKTNGAEQARGGERTRGRT